jgi:hypothetical protein
MLTKSGLGVDWAWVVEADRGEKEASRVAQITSIFRMFFRMKVSPHPFYHKSKKL